jgi:hypothetical protein
MKQTISRTLLLVFAAVSLAGAQHCDATLWNHVYHKSRLTVVKNCVTVSGVVHIVRNEPDGDPHIQLTLDPPYSAMLNAVNQSRQNGALVIEPMCTHSPRQQDAVASCQHFSQQFPALKEGAHVKVMGAYVVDHDPGHGWREIHPISSVESIP